MQSATESVRLKYSIADKNGNIIDSSNNHAMLLIPGTKQFFKPIEYVLAKMNVGERKRVLVNSKDAYGEYNVDLVLQMHKSKFSENHNIGDKFILSVKENVDLNFRLVSKENDIFILDGNHILAGVDLVFEIELINRQSIAKPEGKSNSLKMVN